MMSSAFISSIDCMLYKIRGDLRVHKCSLIKNILEENSASLLHNIRKAYDNFFDSVKTNLEQQNLDEHFKDLNETFMNHPYFKKGNLF